MIGAPCANGNVCVSRRINAKAPRQGCCRGAWWMAGG
jgi:hypothetical protein